MKLGKDLEVGDFVYGCFVDTDEDAPLLTKDAHECVYKSVVVKPDGPNLAKNELALVMLEHAGLFSNRTDSGLIHNRSIQVADMVKGDEQYAETAGEAANNYADEQDRTASMYKANANALRTFAKPTP